MRLTLLCDKVLYAQISLTRAHPIDSIFVCLYSHYLNLSLSWISLPRRSNVSGFESYRHCVPKEGEGGGQDAY